jgi:RNA polymerase sigma factor (TIGR02999 family)
LEGNFLTPDPDDVTSVLMEWGAGQDRALEKLVPLVYRELRSLAASQLRGERPAHTLQPTALVNEVFLRLLDGREVVWQNRTHFFALAARMMRHILVDHARARLAEKRGGGASLFPLEGPFDPSPMSDLALVALDDALATLKRMDPRQCRIVELRYFAGLTLEETAESLGISVATVKRDWTMARAWLRREVEGRPPSVTPT